MKNIGVFCDGTWQHLDQPNPTNVATLARAVSSSANGSGQIVYYDDGVGVSQGVLDTATHIVGGALGKGLDYKVARAYQFLALNYDPGDRIFVFGFSRGAYTARCLAGLVRWMGILKRENAGHALDAMAHYRARAPKDAPQADQDAFQADAAAFREAYAHHSDAFLRDKPYVPGDPGSLTPDGDCTWIQYVGVFDTVGSLGVPSNFAFAPELNDKYRFWDTSLSRSVRSARHAVSIDERRRTFSPTLWDNIDELNTNASADVLPYAERPYQQQWFPGGHGSVGGGGPDGGIALPAMLWIAEGAERAGFRFEHAQLEDYEAQANPAAKFLRNGLDVGEFIMELDGMADRRGPLNLHEVSLAARLRWNRVGGYRPAPLCRFVPMIEALSVWEPEPDPQVFFRP